MTQGFALFVHDMSCSLVDPFLLEILIPAQATLSESK